MSTPRASYSSGGSSSAAKAATNTSVDSAAARASRMQQSAQNFSNSKTPPPLPPQNNTSRGASPPPLPNNYNQANSASFSQRSSYTSRGQSQPNYQYANSGSSFRYAPSRYQVLTPYYNRPTVIFGDPFALPFWYFLLDQPRPVRAEWFYHHQDTMAPARQAAMLAADPALQQEVNTIAAKAPPKNPDFTPPGIEKAAMTEELAVEPTANTLTDASPNPNPISSNAPTPPAPKVVHGAFRNSYGEAAPKPKSSAWNWVLLLGTSSLLVWLVFFKRWKSASPQTA